METPTRRYHVAKFGGTSVQDYRAIEAVAAIVQANPHGLVVVLSAMAKVTDLAPLALFDIGIMVDDSG